MDTRSSHFRTWLVLVAVFIGLAACGGTPTKESTGEMIDDTAITTKVKASFAADPEVSALKIGVETFKGVVQLSGFAKSPRERQKAEQLTREVKGVKSVRNDVIVR